jgi:DME family drug/metabolite transporter
MEVPRRERPWVGYGALVFAASLWALIGVYTRQLADQGIDALSVAAWRALLGGACFVLHAVVTRVRRPAMTRADIGGLALFTVVGVSLFFAALPLAIESGDITVAYVLLYTAPAWVTLGAWVFFRDHISSLQLALVGMTVLGAALVSTGGSGVTTPSATAIFWGLIAGLSYSSYYLLGRRLFERLGPVFVFAIVLPLGALPLLVLARPDWPNATSWLLLAGLAIGSTWAPYVALSVGLRSVPGPRAVIVATIEPVIAAMIAASFYDERLAALSWIGAGLILIAATASALRR